MPLSAGLVRRDKAINFRLLPIAPHRMLISTGIAQLES